MTDERHSLIGMAFQESLYLTYHSALRFNCPLARGRTNQTSRFIETCPPGILTERFERFALPFAEAQFSQPIANHGPQSVRLAEDFGGFNGAFQRTRVDRLHR